MKHSKLVILIAATALLVTACTSTTALVTRGVLASARLFRHVAGTASEQAVLCQYYNEHRAEIEAVREYYKANWNTVPEKDKPALLTINDQLSSCDGRTPQMERTTVRVLLDAFRRAVAIYRELRTAGVI